VRTGMVLHSGAGDTLKCKGRHPRLWCCARRMVWKDGRGEGAVDRSRGLWAERSGAGRGGVIKFGRGRVIKFGRGVFINIWQDGL